MCLKKIRKSIKEKLDKLINMTPYGVSIPHSEIPKDIQKLANKKLKNKKIQ